MSLSVKLLVNRKKCLISQKKLNGLLGRPDTFMMLHNRHQHPWDLPSPQREPHTPQAVSPISHPATPRPLSVCGFAGSGHFQNGVPQHVAFSARRCPERDAPRLRPCGWLSDTLVWGGMWGAGRPAGGYRGYFPPELLRKGLLSGSSGFSEEDRVPLGHWLLTCHYPWGAPWPRPAPLVVAGGDRVLSPRSRSVTSGRARRPDSGFSRRRTPQPHCVCPTCGQWPASRGPGTLPRRPWCGTTCCGTSLRTSCQVSCPSSVGRLPGAGRGRQNCS